MKIEKTIKGEKYLFYFQIIRNEMKAKVRLFHGDEWIISNISEDFKYILLPKNKFEIDDVKVERLKLNKHQSETVKEYNNIQNNNDTIELLFIEVTVSANHKMKARVISHDAEDKSKTYTYTNRGGNRKSIKKEDIMKVDSLYMNYISDSNGMIGYHTYCLPEDKEKAIEMLKKKVHSKISELQKCVSNLIYNYKDI